jgi:hypothetical protein
MREVNAPVGSLLQRVRWYLHGIVARDSGRGPLGDLRSAFTLRSNRLRSAHFSAFTPLRMTMIFEM